MFFDSHCHLTSDSLAPQLPEILHRAHEADVSRILNIGDTMESSHAALAQIEVAKTHGIAMRASAGIHPQNALDFSFEDTPAALRELAKNPNIVAIGEIGLDFVYDDQHEKYPGASRELQEEVLRAQLDLARELNLPVVLHNRESDEDLLRVLRDYSDLQGVVHCFTSTLEIAERVLDLGFHLGFTGVISFKNAASIRQVAKLCPLDRLLIETDAPYLTPMPHRGKTNEPSFVPLVAGVLADLRECSIEEIGDITSDNAGRLFQF